MFSEDKYWYKVGDGRSISIRASTNKYYIRDLTGNNNPIKIFSIIRWYSKVEDHGKTGLGNPFEKK